MGIDFTTNIAFAGLTAAGKTTHAKQLAKDLGYGYVSATEILMEILGIENADDQVWFSRLEEIQAARGSDAIDAELERRLISLNKSCESTIFDTWALAWIGDSPLVRVWIESDFESRARKCLVSQRSSRFDLNQCAELIRKKDAENRTIFQRRHGFDLFVDRQRYDIVLCNSHLIPMATTADARVGIAVFAPIVRASVTAVLRSDEFRARALERLQEVDRITLRG